MVVEFFSGIVIPCSTSPSTVYLKHKNKIKSYRLSTLPIEMPPFPMTLDTRLLLPFASAAAAAQSRGLYPGSTLGPNPAPSPSGNAKRQHTPKGS